MSTYYSLACETCKVHMDAVRRGAEIGPMYEADGFIWDFLYEHSRIGCVLRVVSEHQSEKLDGYTDYLLSDGQV